VKPQSRTSNVCINRAERRVRIVELRRQGLSLRQIAAREGCGVETARRDVNRYMADLDRTCLEGVAALRAELYEKYDAVLQALEHEVLTTGNLDRVPDLLKTSAEIRKLYALDVQPLGRTELALRKALITEIATKLRDQLPPETFAEVAILLTDDEPIQLLDGIAVAAEDEEGTPPPRQQRSGQSNPQSAGQQASEPGAGGLGSGAEPLPVVVTAN
jgi:hypothetical protein